MIACRYGQRPHGQCLVCEEKCLVSKQANLISTKLQDNLWHIIFTHEFPICYTCLTLNIVSALAYVITLSQLCHTLTAMLWNTISFYNCPCIILYLKWFDIKKNWDIEYGEASEQICQKRNSFYLEITLEVSFFFSLEKKKNFTKLQWMITNPLFIHLQKLFF